ncbi:MAG TPA: adenylate kinase [Firmicutes bacterium]|nr:adenylate kinase [Bacillota bacterium]
MYFVLLGPPGAGKGSQAELVAREFGYPHISTGDILRAAVKQESALGIKAKQYMEQGLLVPDELTNAMVADRLSAEDTRERFLMDGFPRTLDQAVFFDDYLAKTGRSLSLVFDIEASDDIIVERLSGRRVCCSCGAIYHLKNKPPKSNGCCDICTGALIQRSDDQPETILERIKVYRKQTEPLKEFYTRKGILREFDGGKSVAEVYACLRQFLQ